MFDSKLPSTVLALWLIAVSSGIVVGQEPSRSNAADKDSIRRPCVWVHGAVGSAARLELHRPVRLSEAIKLAGGANERASQEVQVTHLRRFHCGPDHRVMAVPEFVDRNAKEPEALPVDSYQRWSLVGEDEKSNPYLQSGDIVNVVELPLIYVTGNVLRPQAMVYVKGMTLTRAIDAAEMLRDSNSKILVYRQPPNITEQKKIIVDLAKRRKLQTEDLLLEPYDVVEVRPKRCRSNPIIRSCYYGEMVPDVRIVK
jgi:SLBB domain